MQKRGFAAVLLLFFLVSGCLEDDSVLEDFSGEDDSKKRVSNLLAIYMVGSDLESSKGYASSDIFEILEGFQPSSRDSLEVVLAYGGTDLEGWRGMTIANLSDLEKDAVDGVIGNEDFFQKHYRSANMGDKKSLDTFFSHLRKNYECDKHILIFWDHGDAYRGFCFDENHRHDRLEFPELRAALEGSGLHFDLIGFDACLMANLELAKTLSPSADYMLASETIEPTHGWDYVSLGVFLSENPDASTPEIGRQIIDSYLDNPEHVRPKTLSLLDLSRTDRVLEHFDALVNAMDSRLLNPKGLCGLGASVTKARKFGVEPKRNSEISMDMKSFTLQVKAQNPELSGKADALLETLDTFIVYSRHDNSESGAYGVSVFSPHAGKEAYSAYGPVSVSETWSTFLGKYMERTCADFLKPTFSKAGGSFSVEDDSGLAAVRHIYFRGIEGLPDDSQGTARFPEGSFILLGSEPAEQNESGYYSPPVWDGKWIYLRDRSTGAYSFVSAIYEGENDDGELIFTSEAGIRRNGEHRSCLAHIYLDPENETVNAYMNPYEVLENGELIFSREVFSLEDGDFIFAYCPLIDEDVGIRDWVELGQIKVGKNTEYVFDYLPSGTYYSSLYAEDFHVNFNVTEPDKLVIE